MYWPWGSHAPSLLMVSYPLCSKVIRGSIVECKICMVIVSYQLNKNYTVSRSNYNVSFKLQVTN